MPSVEVSLACAKCKFCKDKKAHDKEGNGFYSRAVNEVEEPLAARGVGFVHT